MERHRRMERASSLHSPGASRRRGGVGARIASVAAMRSGKPRFRWLGLFASLATAVFAGHSTLADGQEPRGPSVDDAPVRVGAHGGLVYLRAFDDRLRIYPGAA